MNKETNLSFPPPEGFAVEGQIIGSLRKIIRAVDIYSKKIRESFGMSLSQLTCFIHIAENDGMSLNQLSKKVWLSPSMITNVIDHLEKDNLVFREHSQKDRRVILLHLSEKGKQVYNHTPDSLQRKLANGLFGLSEQEKETIKNNLDMLVSIIEAENLTSAPVLEGGEAIEGEKPYILTESGKFLNKP